MCVSLIMRLRIFRGYIPSLCWMPLECLRLGAQNGSRFRTPRINVMFSSDFFPSSKPLNNKLVGLRCCWCSDLLLQDACEGDVNPQLVSDSVAPIAKFICEQVNWGSHFFSWWSPHCMANSRQLELFQGLQFDIIWRICPYTSSCQFSSAQPAHWNSF